MAEYKHGTYGALVKTIAAAAATSATVAVYVGLAPVNLIRGFAKYVNVPVKLSSFEGAKAVLGYSDNWKNFDLCEAFQVHFNNKAGNVGPIVAINVLDPAVHKKAEATTKELAFANGSAYIQSDTIILDTLVLAEKVEGVDFAVEYDFTKGRVVITSIGEEITGTVNATYSEVDLSAIDAEDIIGGASEDGIYSGLGCVGLIYQELGLIPNLLLCPGWSTEPEVYAAMIKAAAKINGNWDAFVLADIPLEDADGKVDTIAKAIEWAEAKGYKSEFSKVFWPMGADAEGKQFHASVLEAWQLLQVDATHDGVPMETASNKPVPVVKQYFGAESLNRGFDRQRANELNANGITTVIFWGGEWVLWGPHTAAYKHGADGDERNTFDTNIRMMLYVSNGFQKDWALTIDKPMSRALADTIKNQEQAKMDALGAMGAFIGEPVVEFAESENSTAELVKGNFVWGFKGTPVPPFKSGTLNVGYSADGFETYFREV